MALLVDGLVRRVESQKQEKIATLTLEPFDSLTRQNRDALTNERFVEPEAQSFEVRVAD